MEATLLALLLSLGACQSSNKIVGLPCPCTSQYLCCASLNQCLSPGEFCPDPIEVAAHTQAFTGPDGARVFLVPLVPTGKNQALIEVSGVNHAWNNKVYLHNVSAGMTPYGGFDYTRKVAGRDYVALISRHVSGNELAYRAYLQGSPEQELALDYSEQLSNSTDSTSIRARYYEQGGNVAESLPPPLEQFQAEEDAAFKKILDQANQACESTITATINWPTFAAVDVRTANYSVSKSCGAALDAIRFACIANSVPAKVRAQVREVICNWGGPGQRAINLATGKLTFVLDWTLDDNIRFVQDYLEATL